MVLPLVSCWWWSCCFCLAENTTTNHRQAPQRRAAAGDESATAWMIGHPMAYNTPASASTSHLRANRLCFHTHSTSAPSFCTHSTSAPTSLIFFNSGGGQTFVRRTAQTLPVHPCFLMVPDDFWNSDTYSHSVFLRRASYFPTQEILGNSLRTSQLIEFWCSSTDGRVTYTALYSFLHLLFHRP